VNGTIPNLVKLEYQSPNGNLEATFNPLGARQVSLRHNGRDALQPYDLGATPPFATGFVMAPWANRMRDGSWTDSLGQTHQNPVTEARTNTALHGLLLDTVYEIQSQSLDQVTFVTTIQPSYGYPYKVTTSVTYQLGEAGLTVTHRAVNHSEQPAPFQTGAHPYLFIEGQVTADLEIKVPATHWWQVDDRLLPLGVESVSGTAVDATDWRRLGDYLIDNGFVNLIPDADGLVRTLLRAPRESGDHRSIALWQDANFKQVHVFSTPMYPSPDNPGELVHGITIEPVTAGPDAFNTRVDLIQLSPEVEWSGRWGIQLLDW
jgi:aldose 1-epimerase